MKQSSASWENKCDCCGLCCHERVIVGRELVIDLSSYCEYYDPKTHQCTVYLERLERNARCRRVTRYTAMFSRYLPDACAYVQWARSHHLRFALPRRIRYSRTFRSDGGDKDCEPLSLT